MRRWARRHDDGSIDARLYYKPLVTLIWIGALVMALGGAFSLADRRLRIGVARRAVGPCPAPGRRMKRALKILALAAALLAPFGAQAVEPSEKLADPAQEARARAIATELRCLVCQNQSIDDSDAPLAKDLRMLLREQIRKGASDKEARDYIVARYGDFVLLRPPFKPETLLLWGAPLIALAGGALALWAAYRRRRVAAAPAALSEAERAKLRALGVDGPDEGV